MRETARRLIESSRAQGRPDEELLMLLAMSPLFAGIGSGGGAYA